MVETRFEKERYDILGNGLRAIHRPPGPFQRKFHSDTEEIQFKYVSGELKNNLFFPVSRHTVLRGFGDAWCDRGPRAFRVPVSIVPATLKQIQANMYVFMLYCTIQITAVSCLKLARQH